MHWADSRLQEAFELVRRVRAETDAELARYTLGEAMDAIELADAEVGDSCATPRNEEAE